VSGVVVVPAERGAKAWAREQFPLPFQAPVVVLYPKSTNEENSVTNNISLHEQGLALLSRLDALDGQPLDVEQLSTEPVALAARWLGARTEVPAGRGTTAAEAANQLARAIGPGVEALDLVAAALALGVTVRTGKDGVLLRVVAGENATEMAPRPRRTPVAASQPAPAPAVVGAFEPVALREADAAQALGNVSVGLLRKWRAADEATVALGRDPAGPPWKRLGGTVVVYPVTALKKWLVTQDGPTPTSRAG
jgi:hypothetical protein